MSVDTRADALRGLLVAGGAATQAIVGSRVYFPPWPPGATLPLVTMAPINGGFSRTFGQAVHTPQENWTFQAWAATREAVNDLIQAIIDDLDGQEGSVGAETLQGVTEINLQPWLFDETTKLKYQNVDMLISWS